MAGSWICPAFNSRNPGMMYYDKDAAARAREAGLLPQGKDYNDWLRMRLEEGGLNVTAENI